MKKPATYPSAKGSWRKTPSGRYHF